MNTHLLIPASGIGSRFGSTIPKQYTHLAHGQTILDTTISTLLPLEFASITIVIAPEDTWWANSQHASLPNLTTVIGGKERYNSVMNGLASLQQHAHPTDLVAVHDSVRPIIDLTAITTLIKRIHKTESVGGLVVTPCYDSMKKIENGTLKNIPRDTIYRALTPQIYTLEALQEALSFALTNGHAITDEASAVELLGYPTIYEVSNTASVKITTEEDLVIANSILNN